MSIRPRIDGRSRQKKSRSLRPFLVVAALCGLLVGAFGPGSSAQAQPYAALVMDGRTGEILHSVNAETRLHPASLTKMMTLYIAFEAVRLGEITMDTRVEISRNAASTPYAIGFRAGSEVQLRYLVRAAAIRSSNDATVAIAEAISGSVEAFAARMNRTAAALGMHDTSFVNPHGLTADGHRSTAYDMTIMGRRLFFDYPQYYNIFSRRSSFAGIGEVLNTNRRFLDAYEGADGIKTGYTDAAGYNLTASAVRGSERIIATLFGGHSVPWRNARMAELLDLGFDRAPTTATIRRPALPDYSNPNPGSPPSGAVAVSLIPIPRPVRPENAAMLAAIEEAVGEAMDADLEAGIEAAIAEALNVEIGIPEGASLETDDELALAELETAPVTEAPSEETAEDEITDEIEPEIADIVVATQGPAPDEPLEVAALDTPTDPVLPPSVVQEPIIVAPPRPIEVTEQPAEEIVVIRAASTGGRHWSISLGRFPSRYAAERQLIQTALTDVGMLGTADREVTQQPGGFEARFAGMTQVEAEQACARLIVRSLECTPVGPQG